MVVSERICLRYARGDDVAALAELRAAAMLEVGLLDAAGSAAFVRRARRELARLLREERMIAWVLEVEGRLAGSACVVFWDRLPYPGSSRHAEVAGVYVAPPYRRRGIARELIGEAFASARGCDVRRVFIAPTDRTRAFYRSLGFDDAGWLRI